MSKVSTTIVDLLRHGDVEGGRKYRGHLDDPLSELGWEQLRETTCIHQDWQHIITSPLKRCAEFSQELSEEQSLPLQINSEFKEIYFGLWEGKTAEELLDADAEHIKKYWENPIEITPPEGEALLAFEERIITAWEIMLKEFQGQHILMVSHAGVMRVILCHVLGMPLTEMFKLDIALAKFSRIQIEHADEENWPRLIFHGSHF